MKRAVAVLVALCVGSAAHGDWEAPQNLGPPINTQYDDWYPVIARDGSFMIFVSTRPGGYGDSDLWISHNVNGEWQTPENLGANVNTATTESAPFLAANDSVLYFASFAAGGHGLMDIWWCTLVGGTPGPKSNMGPAINGSALDCCPVMSHDGNSFYICSDRSGGYGSMDAWAFQRVGDQWSTPENMGDNVNSSQTDCPRWISDDDKTLILCSRRLGGYGDADIWYTVKDADVWSSLVNLGSTINSSAAEWGVGFLGNQGTIGGTMYFGSGRSGGHGGWDIWYSSEIQLGATDGNQVPSFLLKAFPNPVSSRATIAYTLGGPAHVLIQLYNLQGRLVSALVDELQGSGRHETAWDVASTLGGEVPQGVCFCKMQAGRERATTRVVVTKE